MQALKSPTIATLNKILSMFYFCWKDLYVRNKQDLGVMPNDVSEQFYVHQFNSIEVLNEEKELI